MQHFVFALFLSCSGVGPCQPCENFQELCTDPCSFGLSIIMLQHELMVGDERHHRIQTIVGRSHADELPWMRSCLGSSLGRNSSVMQSDCCSSRPTGWPQMIFEVKVLVMKVLNWWDERSVQRQRLCWTVQQSARPLHAPSRLATSVSSDKNIHFRSFLLWAAWGPSV